MFKNIDFRKLVRLKRECVLGFRSSLSRVGMLLRHVRSDLSLRLLLAR